MFRLIRRLVILLIPLWLVGELVLIPVAQKRIESEVASRSHGETAVHANIDSFPMAARVLVMGNVKRLTVTLDRVAGVGLRFTSVAFQVNGIAVDRAAILQGKAKIRSIDSGLVTAKVDLGALGRLGSLVAANVTVTGRTLHAGPLAVEIPRDLVPCDPDSRIDGDTIVLTCSVTELPDVLKGLEAPLVGG